MVWKGTFVRVRFKGKASNYKLKRRPIKGEGTGHTRAGNPLSPMEGAAELKAPAYVAAKMKITLLFGSPAGSKTRGMS